VSTVVRFGIELSTLELDVVWRSQPFGELPLILDIPSPGATHAERAALEAQVWTELIERDLADDPGHATNTVVTALQVIARRRLSLHLRTFGPDARRALVAQRGRRTVLGVLDDQGFRLARVADTGLANTLLSLLPEVPAGPGRSVSAPIHGFERASQAASSTAAIEALTEQGLDRTDARTLLDMTTGSIRTGQIAAEVRKRDGHIARSDHVIAFHDTPHGRYQAVVRDEYLTVAPATTTTLARAINTLVHR
jgi:hypothetical protein